jgi:ribonuclease HII
MSTELIGGLDEVGYGAWAGPIISVVAVFDAAGLRRMPVGVTDSKKTTEKRRSMLFLPIIAAAVDVGIGHVWPYEIDSIGVSDALQLCYARALHDLIKQPPILIVDGDSMIAKHFRDEIMISYAKEFPGYDFENNKGYGSKTHEDGIKEHGFLYDANNPDRYLHRKHYCRKVAVRLQK